MRNDNSNIAQNTHSSIYKRGKGKKKNAHLIIIIKSKKKGKEASVIRKKILLLHGHFETNSKKQNIT